jgi:Uma2 family endonuclease
MTPQTSPLPLQGQIAGFRRFTVAEYHRLIAGGHLTEDDPLELIEGYLVHKMPHNPSHDGTIELIQQVLSPVLPTGWRLRIQSAITLSDSEPEPDIAVVRGDIRAFLVRHPEPKDIGLLIEVANSSLDADRLDKVRIYARSNVVCYWILNLVDRQVEVFTASSGPVPSPTYGSKQVYGVGASVPLVLDGKTVATIPVSNILP